MTTLVPRESARVANRADRGGPYHPGDEIDGWIVEAVLGDGGMGRVYRCHNARAPRITGAIKTMRTERMSRSAQKRFVREAELLFDLDHPNIVKVRNVRLGHEPPYLEMEHVNGLSIEDMLRRGPLPLEDALRLFAQLADAVAFIHGRHVQHRDIKPANLLVDPQGRLVLVDFGLARDAQAAPITQTEVLFGTVSYAPPEWAIPAMLDPHRWDVYSMGVVFYEMLTGEVAFPMSSSFSAPQAAVEVMSAKLRSPSLDPGEDFPDPVRALVQQLTHPVPEERPATGIEVLNLVLALGLPDFEPHTPRLSTTPPSMPRRSQPTWPPMEPPTWLDPLRQRVETAWPAPLAWWTGMALMMGGLAAMSVLGVVAVAVSWLTIVL